MELKKITEADLQGMGVVGMEDTPNLSALEMQKKVEEVVREVVIPAINANVDATASKEDLRMAVLNSGAGDMQARSYDSNLDGIVNSADNGIFNYVHTKSGTVHNLAGSGENIKFVAAADWNEGDSLTINGKVTHCLNNLFERVEGEVLFKQNACVTATMRALTDYNRCFFKLGGAGLNFKVVNGTTAPASPKENMIWVNTGTEIPHYDFSAEQPCRRSKNKNLITYPYYHTTQTDNGITYTDNGDGTITANGTATAESRFRPAHTSAGTGLLFLTKGTYTLSGCPAGGSGDSFRLQCYDTDLEISYADTTGQPVTFTIDGDRRVRFSFIVKAGTKLQNAVIKPQLEKGSVATSFVKGDATGQVWIKTGLSSNGNFNALKKDGLFIFPQSCMQWNGSAWVSKDVKVYKNGGWKTLKFWFLQGNNQYTDTTGGWSIIKATNGAYQAATIGSSGMTFTCTANKSINMGTAKAIDFKGINTLYISVATISNASGEGKCMSFGIDETRDFTWTSNAKQGWTVEKFISYPQNGSGIIYALDTSNVNSKCYILMAVTCGTGNTVTVVVNEIYGE